MLKPKAVYVLRDPRTGAVRYVGATCQPLRKRLYLHIYASRTHTHPAAVWVRELADAGLAPTIHVVDPAPVDWQGAEKDAIEVLRALGCMLTNATHGGLGMSGCFPAGETRAKRSASLLKVYADPAKAAERRELGRRAGASDGSKAAARARMTRTWADPVARARLCEEMSAVKRAKLADPAARAEFIERMKRAKGL